jgi:hypothetical protein
VGRRVVARRGAGGGEHIPQTRASRRRLIPAFASIALAGAIVVYSALASDRLPEVVAGVGAAGCALVAVALVWRRAPILPTGLAGVGAAYALYLSLRTGAVDIRAPLVAAGLYAAAETGYWSLERSAGGLVVRRFVALAASALLTALVGSLVLAAATGVAGSVALEAAGVAAAALTVAAIALLASRSSV